MTMQYRQQHRQPVLFEADRQPARTRRLRSVDQRLDLDQQRPRAFLGTQHAGTGHVERMLREEQRRRIGDATQALLGHGEHAEFVDGAETVLHRAHQAKTGMRVTLEIQHGIDHVLQHARAGQAAFLGDVADQDHAGAGLLGEARQLRRAFAHLRHRAGGRLQRVRPDGLDRVDHRDCGAQLDQGGKDFFQVDLGQQLHAADIELQAPRAQRHLLAGFLAGDIQHVLPACARRASDCSSRVDLPIPGSPPISTTPPATSPPPSTRSNSSTPVAWRGSSRGRISASICRPLAPASAAKSRPAGAAVSTTASTRVFHCPQPGHWPCHLGELAPHSVQEYCVFALAIN
jgi:hypothetical protein